MITELVVFGSAKKEGDIIIFDKVDYFLYMRSESLADLSIRKSIPSFVVITYYKGEVTLPEGTVIPPKRPLYLNWQFVERHLPDYDHRDDVLYSDILDRYVNNETVSEEDTKDILEGKPEFLTNLEWAFHKLTELNTKLYLEAMDAKLKEVY